MRISRRRSESRGLTRLEKEDTPHWARHQAELHFQLSWKYSGFFSPHGKELYCKNEHEEALPAGCKDTRQSSWRPWNRPSHSSQIWSSARSPIICNSLHVSAIWRFPLYLAGSPRLSLHQEQIVMNRKVKKKRSQSYRMERACTHCTPVFEDNQWESGLCTWKLCFENTNKISSVFLFVLVILTDAPTHGSS